MSLAVADFWRLIVESRLLSSELCQKLGAEYGRSAQSDPNNVQALADWLISRGALSRYQATVLLAGRPGPFHYGDYRVYDRVSKGRLAGMFRAVHAPTNHPVLLQFVTGRYAQDPQAWAEAADRTARRMQLIGPHVQRYYEAVDAGNFKFLVSEDLRGKSLDEHAGGEKASPKVAALLIYRAACGLDQLHRQIGPHGDIRPRNLWLEKNGSVKLLRDPLRDGGRVDLQSQDPGDDLLARSDYLAPEFLSGDVRPDPLTDIYALGCTLYELIAGRPPFAGGSTAEKMQRHAGERIQPLQEFGAPDELAQLTAYMMAKNPAVRFQEVRHVIEQLEPLVDANKRRPPAEKSSATLADYEQRLKEREATAAAAPPTETSRPAETPDSPAAGGLAPVRAAEPGESSPAVAVMEAPAVKPVNEPAAAQPAPVPVSPAQAAQSVRAQRRGRRSSKKTLTQTLIAGGVAAALLLIGAIVVMNRGDDPPSEPSADPREVASANADGDPIAPNEKDNETTEPDDSDTSSSPAAQDAASNNTEVVPDDGELLWASPTSGGSVSFDHVPPGGQLFFIVRPADMLASDDGAKALTALGPDFAAMRERWESAAGVKLADVEQMIVSLHESPPRAALVVRLVEPLSRDDLLARWGDPAPVNTESADYYNARGWSFFLPEGAEPGEFLMGAEPEVKEVAALGGATPPLLREMNQLREASDNQRHFTALAAPNYLFGDGQQLFADSLEPLREALFWFLGDGLRAGMLSMHFDPEHFYVEGRLISEIDKDRYTLATEIEERLSRIPGQLRDYYAKVNTPPYWRKLAFQAPSMVRTLGEHLRIGIIDDQAVVNSVLPAGAGHNLLALSELSLNLPGAEGAQYAAAPAESEPPQSYEEMLEQKITFEVPAQDLVLVMRDLETEMRDRFPQAPFEFGIHIVGNDLEAEGITRNQQIRDFAAEDQPLSEVLTGLVMKANPVTTVQEPSEEDQKLVWCVGPHPREDKTVILITTRKAAAEEGYELPEPFVAAE